MRFGIDVSEHQDGLSLVQAAHEGIEFVIVRTADGTYRDRTYHSHIGDARQAGLPAQAYHYLRNPSEGTTIHQQVEASLEVMGAEQRPVWLDCETPAGLSLEHVRTARDLYRSSGVDVAGIYTYPRWWRWRMLNADTTEFGALWLASYGADPAGAPAEIFPGAGSWPTPLGMQKPAIWQFGSNATVAGFRVDINAAF